jgi:hypothetical protein
VPAEPLRRRSMAEASANGGVSMMFDHERPMPRSARTPSQRRSIRAAILRVGRLPPARRGAHRWRYGLPSGHVVVGRPLGVGAASAIVAPARTAGTKSDEQSVEFGLAIPVFDSGTSRGNNPAHVAAGWQTARELRPEFPAKTTRPSSLEGAVMVLPLRCRPLSDRISSAAPVLDPAPFADRRDGFHDSESQAAGNRIDAQFGRPFHLIARRARNRFGSGARAHLHTDPCAPSPIATRIEKVLSPGPWWRSGLAWGVLPRHRPRCRRTHHLPARPGARCRNPHVRKPG